MLPGEAPSPGNGVVELSAGQPSWQLVNLDLAERHVRLAIVDSGVVGAVDCLIVS